MTDVLLVLVIVAFFAICVPFVRWCDSVIARPKAVAEAGAEASDEKVAA